MSFLARAWRGAPTEVRAITSSHLVPTVAEDAMMQGSAPRNAMSLTSFNACVTLLADSIGSLSGGVYRKKGAAREYVDPQPTLFNNSPYPGLTWFEWLWMVMECLAVTGNAFLLVTARDKYDRATGLMPLHPDILKIDMKESNEHGWLDPVYRINGKRVPSGDIVHIRRYPVAGAVLGMSVVQKAAAAIGLALAAEHYGLSYFKDSANPSSVLETDQTLDADAAKGVMQRWISSHGGKRRPAILSGGLKWKPIAIAPNEAQFLETRQFQRSEIATLFRIPPHMIGDTTKSTSWGSGIEQMSIGFVKFTLKPWLTCIEQALSELLPRGQFFKFNIDGLLRGDVKTRWEAYRLGRETGVYSVNEIRAFEDLQPVEDGDGRIQPMNFAPLGYEPSENPDQPVDPASAPDDDPDDDPAADGDDEEDDD
ncbi:phage portal protein [Streptomyces massasporeus]|uniref:phage portal protein n=1 Tax=Streptomyces massasporeus TaxID=67324 RepID=UPI00365D9062